VLQEHPCGDPLVQLEAGQVIGNRSVQVEPALGDQLQCQGGGEGLGDAACPEPAVGRWPGSSAQLAHPGAAGPFTVFVVDAHLDTGEARVDERFDGLLQVGAVRLHDWCSLHRLRAVMSPWAVVAWTVRPAAPPALRSALWMRP
jgi:hypothetical protein